MTNYNSDLSASYDAIKKSYEVMGRMMDEGINSIAEDMVNGTNINVIFDRLLSFQDKVKSTFQGINETVKNYSKLEEDVHNKRMSNENKYYNARITHQREINKLQNKAIDDIYAKYKKEEKILNDIYYSNARLKRQTELDLINEMSNKYKTLNNEQLKGSIDVAKKELELQKKIYEQKGKFTKEDYKKYVQLQEEKKKLQIKTIDDVYKKAEERATSFGKSVANAITGILNKAANVYLFDNLTGALSEMSSAYESNFTSIAGRTGYQDRKTTHDFIYSGFTNMRENNLMGSLNYNTEVIPALVEATSKGFLGEEAMEVAVSNAIDKKIMPWLDTSSETWTQMQWTLGDDSLKQLKGQQLLLQESRTGNRLLQSGVIDSLIHGLEPLLLQIDTNTNPLKLAEYMAKAAALKEMAPTMTTNEITGFLNKAIQLESARGAANMITSGAPGDIYAAIRYMQGASPVDALGDSVGLFSSMISTENPVLAGLGLNTLMPGWDSFVDVHGGDFQSFFSKVFAMDQNISYEELEKAGEEAIQKYNETISNSNSYVTRTTEYDNNMKNNITSAIDGSQLIPHGVDLGGGRIIKKKNIKNWLINNFLGNLLGEALGGLFNKGFSKLIGKSSIGSKLLGSFGETYTYKGGRYTDDAKKIMDSLGVDKLKKGQTYHIPNSGSGLKGKLINQTTGTISKFGASLASTGGALIGAGIGLNQEWDAANNTVSYGLDGKDIAKNTQAYKDYKKSLEKNANARKTGSTIGAVVGGGAGIAGGAAAGAAVGAAVGTVVPVVGNIIGAAVGGLIGAAGGFLGAKIGGELGAMTSPITDVLSAAATDSLNNLSIPVIFKRVF